MQILLWLIVGLPFLGSLILAIFGAYMPKKIAGAVGVASVGASWVLAMLVSATFLRTNPSGFINTTLYTWMNVGGLNVGFSLHLDALSLVMMDVITLVAFLIHLYSFESMYDQDGYSRFFSYMNLFVGSMLTLILAGNLLPLYLGWEGVGLCSYLLIGFWYKVWENGYAAQKAFIITRIGDTAFTVALYIIFRSYHTLDLPSIFAASPAAIPSVATRWIAVLLLAAAVAKSAQIPLQTWLPDAMAGPTPVSALLHAATMVIAGVYLIARMHPFFTATPVVQYAVAIIGTVTLIYAGLTAMVQKDIKRVLAYSTMSQIGYMFLALGVGSWTGAIFHFLTHAFFKSLLFLSAGVVIDAMHEEHDIMRMGGLRKQLPTAFWTFLIGSASLSALPFVTAGFYSKDAILWAAWSSSLGSTWLWVAAMAGALITSIYTFRVVFLVFFGNKRHNIAKQPGPLMKLSLWVLAFFSITAGFIRTPEVLGNYDPFGRLIGSVLPPAPTAADRASAFTATTLLIISAFVSLFGVYIAYLYYRRNRWAGFMRRAGDLQALYRFLYSGWGFDWLYNHLFVRPYEAVAFADQSDVVDRPFTWLGAIAGYFNRLLSDTQTGRLRDYAVGVAIGVLVVTAIVLLR